MSKTNWSDGPGQATVVAGALRAANGNKTKAARSLGMSRRHLYRLLSRSLVDTPGNAETPCHSETSDNGSAGVTPTLDAALTYSRSTPTFRSVELGATAEVKEISVEIPMDLYDWLDDEAHLRKRAERRPRPAKSPIVIEALQRLREELLRSRAPDEKP